MNRLIRLRAVCGPLFALAAGSLPASGLAAERSWIGTQNGSWSQDLNWTLSQPPVTGDSVVFAGVLGNATNTQDISGLLLSQLRFAPLPGGESAQSWTVNGNVTAASVLNQTRLVQTIANFDGIIRATTVDNATTRSDAGAIYLTSLFASNNPINRSDPYTVTLKPGANGIVVNAVTGTGDVVVDGPGYVSIFKTTENFDPNNYTNSSFKGTVFVNSGTLVLGNGYTQSTSVTSGPGTVRLAAGTNLNFDDNTSSVNLVSAPGGYATLRTRGTGTTLAAPIFTGSFVKAGTGTLQLDRIADGTNFSVTQNSLAINTNPELVGASTLVTLGTLNVEPGAFFLVQNTAGVAASALTGTGTVDIQTGGFSFRPSGYAIVTPKITGVGQFQMGGTGIADVRTMNDFQGGTAVYGGTLNVTTPVGGLGGGSVTVYDGGTLSGTGRVSGTVTVRAGGTVAPSRADTPGLNTGTFTVGGLNLTAGGNVAIEFNGITQGTQVDLLAVNNGGAFGDANITNGTLSLSRGTNFFPASGKFPKVSVLKTGSSGSLTGVFARVNGVRVNDSYSFAVTYDAQNVYAQLADVSDTNLDNLQDYRDIFALAGSYKTGAVNQTWTTGDLSGDGTVDYTDLLLANSYVPRLTTTQFATLLTLNYQEWYDYGVLNGFSVPEPASLTALSLAGLLLGRRRRTA